MIQRRGFLGLLLAGSVAPSIVRADSLMKIARPPMQLWADGVHDDTAALNYWINKPGFRLNGGTYLLSDSIRIRDAQRLFISNAAFFFSRPVSYAVHVSGYCLDIHMENCFFDMTSDDIKRSSRWSLTKA